MKQSKRRRCIGSNRRSITQRQPLPSTQHRCTAAAAGAAIRVSRCHSQQQYHRQHQHNDVTALCRARENVPSVG